MFRIDRKTLFGAVMLWTVLTTVFAWLPLVRIMARPEGYHWGILGVSGNGTDGPYWLFILLTLYALTMLFSAYRGPRALFYPMLMVWHLAVMAVLVTGVVFGGTGATMQGQGLHWVIPMWLLLIAAIAFTGLAIAWAVADYRSGGRSEPARWTRANTRRLSASLALLLAGLVLFRAGTNYNWVTTAAIIATILHWILLVESFQPISGTRQQGENSGIRGDRQKTADIR